MTEKVAVKKKNPEVHKVCKIYIIILSLMTGSFPYFVTTLSLELYLAIFWKTCKTLLLLFLLDVFLLASKYKDVSSSKANGSSNVRMGTSWNLPESPQPSISSSRKKDHAQSGKSPLSKSPINRSGRFISTAERVCITTCFWFCYFKQIVVCFTSDYIDY